MKLVYFTHNKKDKNSGSHNIIGIDGGPYFTIHLKSNQKTKKKVEFKPTFSGYELNMNKLPLVDKYLSGQFINFLNKKEDANESN